VGEHFVLDDGSILVDEDIFDGECGYFREENAAKGVGDRGVDASEGEFGVMGRVLVEGNVEILKVVLVYNRACTRVAQ
jgi:hypothetical protein